MKYDYDYDPKTNKVILPKGEFNVDEFDANEFANYVSLDFWFDISIHKKLSESFIEKYKDKWDLKDNDGNILWWYIIKEQKLSESFIEKHKDKWDFKDSSGSPLWVYIIWKQKLSESFIDKFKDKWDLKDSSGNALRYYITKYQKLSINIILKYYDKIENYLYLYRSKDEKDEKIVMFLKFRKGQ